MKSAPIAQALLAGILQRLGEKHNDPQMIEAGLRLAAIAIENDRKSKALIKSADGTFL